MDGITLIIVVLVSVLLSMTVHEAMHAFAGYALGDTTAKDEGRLTLNPIKHIDPITTVALPVFLALLGVITGSFVPIFGAAKPVPFTPENLKWGDFGAAAVALAGPFTNLVLAAIGGLIIQLLGVDVLNVVGTSLAATVLLYFVLVNIGFFVFNMIPFPPLDGSRFLYAVAPEPVRGVMRAIESLGFMAIVIFIFFFFTFLQKPFALAIGAVLEFLTGVSLF